MTWPIPNYTDPVTRPNTVSLIACICGPITMAMLTARLWVRIFHQHNPGWDDWLVVAGTVCLYDIRRYEHAKRFQILTIAATVLFPLGE